MSDEGGRATVLLVEDEVLVRLALADMLSSGGFTVIPVSDAAEALHVLEAIPGIDAVVTDVEMGRGSINGFQLARQVWEERRIGVVVASGRAAPTEGELPDGVHFIAKPVHRGTLICLVEALLEARKTVAQSVAAGSEIETNTARELTGRQREVLELLVRGASTKDIARALELSENTVKVHLTGIFRALGVSSRVEAVLAGQRLLRL